ncbi:NitT/TauT family transport system ATP-binding protein [Rhizobiales bacterium GAS191]|nr:NitT/TauT family transport system ATP-binding protein [Rhizobiales bacterium GAS188]SED00194.1 NitT/TauT family transport system ATP-binding protein [Rhizobiales bacterium GAS191]
MSSLAQPDIRGASPGSTSPGSDQPAGRKQGETAGLAAGSPLVTLAGVSKQFKNGVTALARLDLSVRSGEFLSLLGPSGCGKSTALRLIAGLEQRSAGRIEWAQGSKGPRGRPSIGFVFQDPTLMPWASVESNVFLPLRLENWSFRDAAPRIEEALALVGLADFKKAVPRELSGGMKMRVSIARALVTRPSLLLMDEPFAALDEITRFKLNDDLMRLKQEIGCTVVFVTHSIYESAYLSTRIAVMAARPGRIIAEIDIDAPLPRAEQYRREPAYLDACSKASDALHGAMDPKDHL